MNLKSIINYFIEISKTPLSYITTFALSFPEVIQEIRYSKAFERGGSYYVTLYMTYIVNGKKLYFFYILVVKLLLEMVQINN